MSVGEERHDEPVDEAALTDDDLADLIADGGHEGALGLHCLL